MWLLLSLPAWAADPEVAPAPSAEAEVAPAPPPPPPSRETLAREFLESSPVAPRPARLRSDVDLPPADAPKRWLYFRGWLPKEHAPLPDGRFRYTWSMASFRSPSPGPVVFDGVVLERVR